MFSDQSPSWHPNSTCAPFLITLIREDAHCTGSSVLSSFSWSLHIFSVICFSFLPEDRVPNHFQPSSTADHFLSPVLPSFLYHLLSTQCWKNTPFILQPHTLLFFYYQVSPSIGFYFSTLISKKGNLKYLQASENTNPACPKD